MLTPDALHERPSHHHFPQRNCYPISDGHPLLPAAENDMLFSQDTHAHVCLEPALVDTQSGCFYLLSTLCKGKDLPTATSQHGERVGAENCTLKAREISLGWTFCFSSQTPQQRGSWVHSNDSHDYTHLISSLTSPSLFRLPLLEFLGIIF